MNDDDVKISFSAKELLERIEKKVDGVKDEVTGLTGRVAVLEADSDNRKRRRVSRQGMALTCVTALAAFSTIAGFFHI